MQTLSTYLLGAGQFALISLRMSLTTGTWWNFELPTDVAATLSAAPDVLIPRNRRQLLDLALGGREATEFAVGYAVPGRGEVIEANVTRCRNGLAVNYIEPYMRRRDPASMVVADEGPSEKPRFHERFGVPFAGLRREILDWLGAQRLIALPFVSGSKEYGYQSLLIAPLNAAFFTAALADLQGMVKRPDVDPGFAPRAVIFVAPPFRHTHCDGQQVVVHNRLQDLHEIYSLNLYPGPSAKKGVYGVLLSLGETEGWLTAHGSTVQVVTPYDNIVGIMHEAASGGGKSEMLEHVQRQPDGRLLLGHNTVTQEDRHLAIGQTCALRPVTDDMALCHPDLQAGGDKLTVVDAEEAWFLRVNHIDHYGVDPVYERLSIHPEEPLVFMNMQATPGATCLLWEPIEDAPGVPCPNPRVIIPRRMVPGIVDTPVAVDVRSFGIRTPPATAGTPSYGIFGLLHPLPAALAWLWRLVAPRGHGNPSVATPRDGTGDAAAMTSEGVGSYWPFATGRQVVQANLLLHQIISTPGTRYTLSPNQHVGSWYVGFMPQWITREYLARRGGARFRDDQLVPARCSLLGYALTGMQIEGTPLPADMLQVELQPELGPAGYDAGAEILAAFFEECLRPYLDDADLDPLGRRIIEAALDGAGVEGYEELMAQERPAV
jgi:hypothetical protein